MTAPDMFSAREVLFTRETAWYFTSYICLNYLETETLKLFAKVGATGN